MPRPDGRVVLALFAAGAISFLTGHAFTQVIALIPCRGESLACNRIALAGALAVLLVPPVAFSLITQIEHALYVGLEPQRQLRTFLVTFAPPALTVLVQYLILRVVVPRTQEPRT